MASQAGYEVYEVGDIIMPASIQDYRNIRDQSCLGQIDPTFNVVAVRSVERDGGLDRHCHPQELRICVTLGARKKLMWVSGKVVSRVPERTYVA